MTKNSITNLLGLLITLCLLMSFVAQAVATTERGPESGSLICSCLCYEVTNLLNGDGKPDGFIPNPDNGELEWEFEVSAAASCAALSFDPEKDDPNLDGVNCNLKVEWLDNWGKPQSYTRKGKLYHCELKD